MNIYIIIIIIAFIWYIKQTKEHFKPLSDEFLNNKIKYPIEDDRYMNFLIDLNDNFKKQIKSSGGIKSLCDIDVKNAVESKTLNDAFSKIPVNIPKSEMYEEKNQNNINSSLDSCVYQANNLSELTNPMLYLTSGHIYFPPRWLVKTYKNTPLPKNTDLKKWNSLYHCCKLK